MTTNKELPYWFPVRTDEKWIARIRSDYPEETIDMSDNCIRDNYADGWKYSDCWDNIDEARDCYEKLADAYLELLNMTIHR